MERKGLMERKAWWVPVPSILLLCLPLLSPVPPSFPNSLFLLPFFIPSFLPPSFQFFDLPPSYQMLLHLYTVERVLDTLKPPIESDRKSSMGDYTLLSIWLDLLKPSCNTIDSTLSLPSQHQLATKAR